MTLIQDAFWFIESYLITFTLRKCFDLRLNMKVPILVIVSVIGTEMFRFVHMDMNIIFTLVMELMCFYYLMSEQKHFQLTFLLYPLILLAILHLTRYFGVLLSSSLTIFSQIHYEAEGAFLYASSVVSIYCFIIFCFLFYYIVNGNKKDIRLREWWPFAFTLCILFAMFTNLLGSVIFSIFNIYTIYSFMFEFVVLTICIILFYIKLRQQNEANIQMQKDLIKMEYRDSLYHIMNKSMEQIINEKHMMIYNLMNIRLMIISHREKEANQFIDREISKIMKYKYISSTENALFDYSITSKLNDLMSKSIDVKTVFMVEKNNELLSDETIVDFIIYCIDQLLLLKMSKIELFLQEINKSYLLLKFVIESENKIENTFYHEHVKRVKINNQETYKEVTILLQ